MSNIVVVDGANVAYVEKTNDGKPKVANLTRVQHALEDEGFDPIIIVDASLVYEVDDREQLESLLDQQVIRQAPAETDADFFVLQTAEDYKAQVVTNDQYEDYQERFPWIGEKRLPFMIVKGKVEFYRPSMEENGETAQKD